MYYSITYPRYVSMCCSFYKPLHWQPYILIFLLSEPMQKRMKRRLFVLPQVKLKHSALILKFYYKYFINSEEWREERYNEWHCAFILLHTPNPHSFIQEDLEFVPFCYFLGLRFLIVFIRKPMVKEIIT